MLLPEVLAKPSESSLLRLSGRVLDLRRCIWGEGGLGEGDRLPGEERPGEGGLVPLKDPERFTGCGILPLEPLEGESGERVDLGVKRGPCLSGRAWKVLSALILENAEEEEEEDGVVSGKRNEG